MSLEGSATRPPLVLVHGALGSAAQFAPVAEQLRAAGWRDVHVVELPGHGGTPLDDADAFAIEPFASVLAGALEQLGGPAPIVFGYSMGGYVALALASRAAGASSAPMAAILTLGTKFDWTPAVAEQAAARLDPAVIAAKVPRFAESLAARHADAGGWETVLVRTSALLRALGARPLLTAERLARVAIPVCCAVGALDDTVSVEETAAAAARLPQGESAVLDDVGHPIERVPAERIDVLLTRLAALGISARE